MLITRSHNQLPTELGPTQLIAVSSLKFPRSARKYSNQLIKQAARFIETFGIRLPVLVDGDRNVVAGEIWARAIKSLDLPEIPVLFVEGLSGTQMEAYRVGIQKIPELAEWDNEVLCDLFKDWTVGGIDFDIELSGFSVPEIDSILIAAGGHQNTNDFQDCPQSIDIGPAITQPGDNWIAGRHRVLCGSSIERSSYEALMGDNHAAVVMTDPPYNVEIDGHAGGKGQIHHRDFAMASGEMDRDQFAEFLRRAMGLLADYSSDGSLHYLFMDWRHATEMLQAGSVVYQELKNVICWVKSNAGMGSLYRSQHELVFLFKKGKAAHRNNVQLGRHGRNRTNVWNYAGATSPSGRKTDEGDLLAVHPTVKPVQMLADAILDSSARGDIVLDSFLGSGSTLIAAERVGRRLFGIEIDPHYVDAAIRRWQRQTGLQAIHQVTRRPFDENVEADPTHSSDDHSRAAIPGEAH